MCKRYFPIRRLLVLLVIVRFCVSPPAMASDSSHEVFESDVRPVLKGLCYQCHGPANNESGIRLDQLNPNMVEGNDAESWHDVLNQISQGEMPPAKATQPSPRERRLLTQWIGSALREAAAAKRFKDGRVLTRRLTRYEYANTMRDLLGVDLDFARNLPPEPVSPTGFLNDGATLEMSPTQIEMYLGVARRALAEAIVIGERPTLHEFSQRTTAIGNLPTKKVAGHQPVNPEFILDLKEFPRHGEFELSITAQAATPNNEAFPRMRVSLGHVPGIIHVPRGQIGEIDVTEELQTYTLRGRMEDFPQPGPVSFGNSGFKGMIVMIDFIDADGKELRYPDRKYAQRAPQPKKKGEAKKEEKTKSEEDRQPVPFGKRLEVRVTAVEFKAPVYASWPPPSHQRLLFESEHADDESRYVRDLLHSFMTRAFRRPVTEDEVEQTAGLFDTIRPQSESFEQALRETFASVLVSPHFLYIVEQASRQSENNRVTDWELASRLSYFLWSTAPDQTLLDLAGEGRLRQPDVLGQQVDRMLSDDRCTQFVQRFVDQWLDLDALNRVAVNPEFFPDFDNNLKHQMRKESQVYFSEILRGDRSALELLDSDWAMLNRPLAIHYGLTGPRSSQFERVALEPGDRRGGLLWQAAFHLANSNGEDSHPIKRAVWILDRLLDSPPAPPPPDVPELNPERPDLAKLTLKEQLAVHREKESCASCHNGIDPWGIPLENFDAVGRWRTEIPAHKKRPRVSVDARSVLPDGAEIEGARQLQRYLLEDCDERFARSLVRRLMAYGLGRTLDFGDRQSAQTLTQQFIEKDFKLKSLIRDFVLSDTFQTK
ncbi:DUF1592 domain-containing protein [Stieleria varia]|uniref:Planctomycete cytochrome C n=1 Tax=Stieleria varia TaxID=2528005 RepID=A0A5C6BBI7_9BACT|nr:DUF1592 domain-containing protein [Stieleria varia]TWU07894.1 Planctomycete cytochrome C [Stieleria varia]